MARKDLLYMSSVEDMRNFFIDDAGRMRSIVNQVETLIKEGKYDEGKELLQRSNRIFERNLKRYSSELERQIDRAKEGNFSAKSDNMRPQQ